VSVLINKAINKNAKLGIWNINESESWYLNHDLVTLQVQEQISKYKNKERKLQSISVLLLANTLIGNNYKVKIEYSKNGKPNISKSAKQISVSHSGEKVAVIISKKNEVGIDIEKISNKIEKVSCKFMNEVELELCEPLSGKSRFTYMHVVWGAKESMFKLYSKGGLGFRKNMFITSFSLFDQSFTGHIKKGDYNKVVSGSFMIIEGYMLVYVLGDTIS